MEDKKIDNDIYNFIDEAVIRNLIYEKILRDKNEKVTLDIYRNLIIETPESKNSILEKASKIAKLEIEARKTAKKNICGLFLEDCAYCLIVEECLENLNDKKARGEQVEIKTKTDFRIQWKVSNDSYFYNDRNYAIVPDIPESFQKWKYKIKMNDLFFACFCEKRFDRKRKLIMNGNDLFPRIGRRFQDSDMQSLVDFLKNNRDVASVCLAYNEIHCKSFTILVDYLKENQEVLELNLQSNEIREIGIRYLCREPKSLKLRMLRLNGNKFGVESSKEIALFLAKNPYLKHLDVAEVDQTLSSLVYYTTVLRFDQDQYSKTLQILDISRPNPGFMCNFDSAHFATLVGSMLKFNKTLVELHLQKYGFSCHDIELLLIDGKHNKTLHLLDLNENNIGDYGVDHLANWFTEKPDLRGLLLSRNIVTNNGARTLSFCLPFSKIRMLDLSHNRIDDAGAIDILNTIKKYSPIRHLRLFGNRITHRTAKIVERMLLSGVLVQENLDLKPCKVDDKLHFAHFPADHYKARYYNVPSHSYPKPLRIPFIKNVFEGMANPKVNFQYVDPVPIVPRRPKINKDYPFECFCCKCIEDQIMNSLASSFSTLQKEIPSNICECCVCSTFEEKKLLDRQPEISPECLCEESQELFSKILEKIEPLPLSLTEKVELILQEVDSEIGKKILRWITIDESTLEEDLNEMACTKQDV